MGMTREQKALFLAAEVDIYIYIMNSCYNIDIHKVCCIWLIEWASYHGRDTIITLKLGSNSLRLAYYTYIIYVCFRNILLSHTKSDKLGKSAVTVELQS